MSTACSCVCEDELQSPWEGADCHIAVTGASRGFGRALCTALIKLLTKMPGSAASVTMLLLGRDLDALAKTKDLVMLSKSSACDTEVNLLISQPPLDMAVATEHTVSVALQPLLNAAESVNQVERKQWNLLIHNAANLGALELRADEKSSLTDLNVYYHINLIAPMLLTSVFLHHFAPFRSAHSPVIVLNVTSLAAIQPLPHMSDYCIGKAAREMYMKTLAVDRPTVAVFNYSAGPLDTEMYTDLLDRIGDPHFKTVLEERKRNGLLIAPEESARVCVSWFRRCHFTESSGNQPKALVCPTHQADYLDIWRGIRLDYYDAVAMEKSSSTQDGS